MKIDHIALWTSDLEKLRKFYHDYFGMKAGEKYENRQKGFSSYFLSFENGARIEIMKTENNSGDSDRKSFSVGLAHFAISVGSVDAVNNLTERLKNDGYKIIGEPRTTGDGYYESVFLDPDGNTIEITG